MLVRNFENRYIWRLIVRDFLLPIPSSKLAERLNQCCMRLPTLLIVSRHEIQSQQEDRGRFSAGRISKARFWYVKKKLRDTIVLPWKRRRSAPLNIDLDETCLCVLSGRLSGPIVSTHT